MTNVTEHSNTTKGKRRNDCMSPDEKLKKLKNLKESQLRKEVLILMFKAMDTQIVIDYHGGTLELGKDIIYAKKDEFGEMEYTGVVVKAEDITGKVSKVSSASVVLTQSKQALQNPFLDNKGIKRYISKCLVITSGKINKEAINSIHKELQSLNFAVKFINGEELVKLIDNYMPMFFFTEFDFFQSYYDALKKEFRRIHETTFLGGPKDIGVEEIFVKLRLAPKVKELESKDIDEFKQRDFIDRTIIDSSQIEDKFKTLIILGAPGAGKTTLLRHLVLKRCKSNLDTQTNKVFPIYIRLDELAQAKTKSIKEYIIKDIHERYKLSEFEKCLNDDLSDGKVLLLLDGFDEIQDATQQHKIQNLIQEFTDSYPENKIFASSRIAGYKDELTKYDEKENPILFPKVEIVPFTDDQIKQFLDKWFKDDKDSKRKIKDIWDVVSKNERIKEIARNPLILSLLAIVSGVKKLPERKTDLYRKCIELLMSKWDSVRRVVRQFYFDDERTKRRILQQVALDMQKDGITTIARQRIENLIGKHLAETQYSAEVSKEFLKEIEKSSYLIHEISRNRYQFMHLTFQEYLAAYQLYEEQNYDLVTSFFRKPKWQETIILFAGIIGKIDKLVEALKEKEKSDVILLAKCLTDAQSTDKKIKIDVAKNLLEILSKLDRWEDEYEEIRIRIAGIGKDIIPWLGEELKRSSDFRLSKDVCNILGKIRDPGAIPVLKERLAKTIEPNANVRYAAYEALEKIGTKESMELISKIFVIDPKKLKGAEPFEIDIKGKKIKINDDGRHPGMVRIPGDKKDFWIDVYPVTNAEFEQVFPGHERSPYSPYDDSPVTRVTWHQADEYAKKIGKRLPTEQEWEKAAKGPENWEYSFGKEFDINKCRVELARVDGAAKINSVYDENVNDYGVYDMTGNVWEWTDSWYDEEKSWRVLRGGSWSIRQGIALCSYRSYVNPDNRGSLVGFRCARTL